MRFIVQPIYESSSDLVTTRRHGMKRRIGIKITQEETIIGRDNLIYENHVTRLMGPIAWPAASWRDSLNTLIFNLIIKTLTRTNVCKNYCLVICNALQH